MCENCEGGIRKMVNVENEIFNIVAKAVRKEYPGAYVVGEYVKAPSK